MRRAYTNRRRGAAATELALWLPILVGILSCIVDFSTYMSDQQLTYRAARDACKMAASVVYQPDATNEEIEKLVEPAVSLVVESVLRQVERPCNGCYSFNVVDLRPTPETTLRVIEVIVKVPTEPAFGLAPVPTAAYGRVVLPLDRQSPDR